MPVLGCYQWMVGSPMTKLDSTHFSFPGDSSPSRWSARKLSRYCLPFTPISRVQWGWRTFYLALQRYCLSEWASTQFLTSLKRPGHCWLWCWWRASFIFSRNSTEQLSSAMVPDHYSSIGGKLWLSIQCPDSWHSPSPFTVAFLWWCQQLLADAHLQ